MWTIYLRTMSQHVGELMDDGEPERATYMLETPISAYLHRRFGESQNTKGGPMDCVGPPLVPR